MKNKIASLYILFAFVSSNMYSDEIDLYKKAYDYITHDSTLMGRINPLLDKKIDTLSFYVSEQVLTFNPEVFTDEILDYEFSGCSEKDREAIDFYLGSYYTQVYDIEDSLQNFNPGLYHQYKFNLILFFSKIYSNKLTATINFYRYWHPLNFSYYNGSFRGVTIHYMFYFNENYSEKDVNISKVFLSLTQD